MLGINPSFLVAFAIAVFTHGAISALSLGNSLCPEPGLTGCRVEMVKLEKRNTSCSVSFISIQMAAEYLKSLGSNFQVKNMGFHKLAFLAVLKNKRKIYTILNKGSFYVIFIPFAQGKCRQ